MPVSIEVSDLEFRYGEVEALRGVSFKVEAGARYGLIGPNGGGKSTLMKLLSTALPLANATAGRIAYFGKGLPQAEQAVREKIGVVFQTSTLDKKLSIRENLSLMGRLQGISGTTLSGKVRAITDQLDLTAKFNSRVETLSGGLKRRAELALALLHSPEVVLLDEPTTGLDPLVRREFWSLLTHVMKERGTTVVLATHLLDEAEFCDRLALIHEGKIFAEGTPQSFIEQAQGDIITITAKDPAALVGAIEKTYTVNPQVVGWEIQFELPNGRNFVGPIMEKWGPQIEAITVRKAGLESFFIKMVAPRQVA